MKELIDLIKDTNIEPFYKGFDNEKFTQGLHNCDYKDYKVKSLKDECVKWRKNWLFESLAFTLCLELYKGNTDIESLKNKVQDTINYCKSKRK